LRVGQRFTLSAEQEAQLQAYARGRKGERRLVERARIVLLGAQGKENLEIASRLDVSKRPVDPVLIRPRKCLIAWELLIREAIPDVTEKVAALGFGLKELLVLIRRKGEVAINLAAVEAEVKNPARRDASRSGQELGFDWLPVQTFCVN
jgi:DNA-binding CsgD family transcriptional regulator